MRNHRNNNRRNKFRNNGRGFRRNGSDLFKINSDNNSNNNFIRRNYNRNNLNASKLIEKYNNLAREALSNGDKILSENFFQHADHFLRVSIYNNLSKEDKKNPSSESNLSKDSDQKLINETKKE